MLSLGTLRAWGQAGTRDWRIETVDWFGFAGDFVAMALDGTGNPHLVHYDERYGELRYAWYDGLTWNHTVIDDNTRLARVTTFRQTYVERHHPRLSLVRGPDNRFHVLYEKYEAFGEVTNASGEVIAESAPVTHLRHGVGGFDSPWQVQTVDGSLRNVPRGPGTVSYGMSPSLAVDSTGLAHLAYWRRVVGRAQVDETAVDFEQQEFVYATVDAGGGGQTRVLFDASPHRQQRTFSIFHTEIAVDSLDRPHIVYDIDHETGGSIADRILVHWYRDDAGNWTSEQIDHHNRDDADREDPIPFDMAIDSADRLHVVYSPLTSPTTRAIRHAVREGNDWTITTVADQGVNPTLALDLLTPHIVFVDAPNLGIVEGRLIYARPNGSGWDFMPLPVTSRRPALRSSPLALAPGVQPLIAQTLLNAGFSDDTVLGSDLGLWRYDYPWQIRTVHAPGDVGDTSIDVALRGTPHISYAVETGPTEGLWHAVWSPSQSSWIRTPVAESTGLGRGWYNSVGLISGDLGPGLARIASHNPEDGTLEFSEFDGVTWVTETVVDPLVDDSGKTVGTYADLIVDESADPSVNIAHFDFTDERIRLAHPMGDSWRIHTNTAMPSMEFPTGDLGLVVPPPRTGPTQLRRYIFYPVSPGFDIRVAAWDADTQTWLDQRAGGDDTLTLGSPLDAHWQSSTDDFGGPMVAYRDSGAGEIRLTWGVSSGDPIGFLWQSDTAVSGVSALQGIALRGLGRRALIAFGEYPSGLRLASGEIYSTFLDAFTVEDVDLAPASRISMDVLDREWISYRSGDLGNGVLKVAFRTENPHAAYLALSACVRPAALALSGLPALQGVTPSLASDERDDLTILRGLRDFMAQSSEGVRLIELYYTHTPETGMMGIASPELSADALSVIRDFLPGFREVVNGGGAQGQISQGMVDRVNSVWDRLVVNGSAELGAAIDGERAKYDGLQDFVGMTFRQWAITLGIAPAPDPQRIIDMILGLEVEDLAFDLDGIGGVNVADLVFTLNLSAP